jgi:SAM-dependent methyltransferase
MVNLAQYNPDDDYSHHKKEFENAYKIFCPYENLEKAVVLDLCAGTGLHMGFLMEKSPAYVYGVDLLDYSTLWGGNFKQKIIDVFQSHGIQIDDKKCQFLTDNAENLLFKNNFFDFIYCINAFEHIGNPLESIIEIWRVLRPGGYAFIQFDPIYYCDTGSHMFDFLSEPWLHLILPHDEYIQRLRAAQCPPSIIEDFIHGLNRKPKEYFLNLFTAICSVEMNMFKKIVSYEWSGVQKESHMTHPNYFRLLNHYSHDDLTFRGMNFLLEKRSI